MKIQTGKKYKTKDGSVVSIDEEDADGFSGTLNGRPIYYTKSGQFIRSTYYEEHRLDLTAELKSKTE